MIRRSKILLGFKVEVSCRLVGEIHKGRDLTDPMTDKYIHVACTYPSMQFMYKVQTEIPHPPSDLR